MSITDHASKLPRPEGKTPISSETWDVAIAGGGIAGGVAAFHLARQGLKTLILEKDRMPTHRVCGEFLSGEGVSLLEEIGIDFRALGAAPITGFRLHGPTRSASALLPVRAYGLSRLKLDEAILARAEEAGARIERGASVKEKIEGLTDGASAITIDSSVGAIRARRMIVSTGKSELRTLQARKGRDNSLVGFKMHLRLKPSLAARAKENCELFVFEHGYGGLAPIENGLFNFCFLIEKSALRTIGTDWDSLSYYIARHNLEASRYLDGAEPQFRHFLTVANVPYGFVRREKPEPGMFFVGDQMAVIPSLTGDGMSIAAMTGYSAAYAISNHGAAAGEHSRLRSANVSVAYQREMRRRLLGQVDSAFYLHWLFRNPRLCDWATMLVTVFPQIVDLMFSRTRVRIDPPPFLNRMRAMALQRLQA